MLVTPARAKPRSCAARMERSIKAAYPQVKRVFIEAQSRQGHKDSL